MSTNKRALQWWLGVLALAILLNLLLFGPRFILGEFNIDDQYKNLSIPGILALFTTVATAFFLVMGFRVVIGHDLGRILFPVTTLVGFFCVMEWMMFSSFIDAIPGMGWTIYPPLSALEEKSTLPSLSYFQAVYFIQFLQWIIGLILIYVIYRWGWFNSRRLKT